MNREKKALSFLMALCLAFAGALLLRAAWIQLKGDPRLAQMVKRQFQAKVLVRPRRGVILDRQGETLAANTEISSLAANPSKIKNKKQLARLLSKATGLAYPKLLAKLSENREFVWIQRHIQESEFNRFKRFRLVDPSGDFQQGLWIIKEALRVYPHGTLAAHVIGDVNLDADGIEGAELWWNDKLRGKLTSFSAIRDALGRPAFIDAQAAGQLQDGEDLRLTLDSALQFAVEQELKQSVKRTGARAGSVIVMNAMNGEILALANEPGFDPNQKGAPAERRRNRALTDGYEPGSTLKSVLLASALSHGSKLTDQLWGGLGQMTVQGKKISEAEAHEKFEWLSLKRMIQRSSNIGAARLALKIGTENYRGTLESFGFGVRSGLGFPGEIPGRMPSPKAWQPLTLANVGFGQGLLVTPLQMIRAYAAFLNGGWLVQPQLIVSNESAPPSKRILEKRVCDEVVEALESVVQEEGTGVQAQLTGYRIAGKTGTAQVVDPLTKTYSKSRYITSFIGFPLDVNQKIVVFTSLDEPKTPTYYASDTAVPLFREVLRMVVHRLNIPASRATETLALIQMQGAPSAPQHAPARENHSITDVLSLSQAHPSPSPSSAAPSENPVPVLTGMKQWQMPALGGLSAREALVALKDHPFRVRVHGVGLVRSQVPAVGGKLVPGDTIRLQLSEK